MSESAQKLFDNLRGLKEAVQSIAPGLKDLIPEVGAEVSRMGTQGAMELASALFNGHGFVPYGPGQYTPSAEQQPQLEQEQEQTKSVDGMER